MTPLATATPRTPRSSLPPSSMARARYRARRPRISDGAARWPWKRSGPLFKRRGLTGTSRDHPPGTGNADSTERRRTSSESHSAQPRLPQTLTSILRTLTGVPQLDGKSKSSEFGSIARATHDPTTMGLDNWKRRPTKRARCRLARNYISNYNFLARRLLGSRRRGQSLNIRRRYGCESGR